MEFWKGFLKQWDQDILTILKKSQEKFHGKCYYSDLAKEALEKGCLSFPGAQEKEIIEIENRLNMKLPPSYRDFLKETNGWRQLGFDGEDGRIFSIQEIELFSVKYKTSFEEWLSGYGDYSPEIPDELYFVYGPEQDTVNIRNEYLKTALAISEHVDSAVYLLNPQVRTSDGEWESWFFCYDLPGAMRYRSFQAMMEGEYVRILKAVSDVY